MAHRHGAGYRHEVARKRWHLFYQQIDGKAGGQLQLFRRAQLLELETDGHGHAAGNQNFCVLVAQEMIEAGEKTLDFILALWHFRRLVGLQNIRARHGRHAQGLGEDAGQAADAKIYGQLIVGRYPAVITQHGSIERRAQRQPAVLAIARRVVVLLLAARALDATKTKLAKHVRLPQPLILRITLPSADSSRAAPFLRALAHHLNHADPAYAGQTGATLAQLRLKAGRQRTGPVSRQQDTVAGTGLPEYQFQLGSLS